MMSAETIKLFLTYKWKIVIFVLFCLFVCLFFLFVTLFFFLIDVVVIHVGQLGRVVV